MIRDGHASAVLAASLFHFGTLTVGQVKTHLATQGLPVRRQDRFFRTFYFK